MNNKQDFVLNELYICLFVYVCMCICVFILFYFILCFIPFHFFLRVVFPTRFAWEVTSLTISSTLPLTNFDSVYVSPLRVFTSSPLRNIIMLTFDTELISLRWTTIGSSSFDTKLKPRCFDIKHRDPGLLPLKHAHSTIKKEIK